MLFSLRVGAISNRPKNCFFHFLGFGRLKIAPTVRENYSEGKLLILIAFIACRGDFQSPESLLFSSLLSWAIENRPYYSRGKQSNSSVALKRKKKSSSSSHTKILKNRRLFAKKVVPLQPNSINIMSNSLT